MMKLTGLVVVTFLYSFHAFSQVDTSFIYQADKPYGVLDLRLAKSSTQYYYLQEGKTFSFRELNGVQTNSYLDMTLWNSSPYQEGNLREKVGERDNFVMNYRLLMPGNYDASYDKGYPLVIVMHGRLESGNCADNKCHHATRDYHPAQNIPPAPTNSNNELLNNDYNLNHGGRNYLEAHDAANGKLPDDPLLSGRAFPGFVFYPQSLNGWDGASAEDAIRIARLLMKKYNIDEDKIYINGISNGGHGAYEALQRAPWFFAAAALFSAADDAQIVSNNLSATISNIPLWIFQGGTDVNPSPKETESYIKAFKTAGASIRYTNYAQLGHGTWNAGFDEPDFFTWMLGRNKANIHVFADQATLCKTNDSGLLLSLPEGYKTYQWEYNDQVITDAKRSRYEATSPGNYRARYSSFTNPTAAQWNDWSEPVSVLEQEPPVANIRQTGTTLLRDLNANNNALLYIDGSFAHHYWYKNDVLINFPGEEDDTLKNVTLKPSNGKGVYTVRVAGYDQCLSLPSMPKYLYFNDQAPVNLAAPTNFAGQSISPSAIVLTWQCDAEGETGFEIWRRNVSDADTSAWQMAVLAGANATTFEDSNLFPSQTYHYKIRAVSNGGRSIYTPSAVNEHLVVVTAEDKESPTAPMELIADKIAVKALRLHWRSSQDNAAVNNYQISLNDSVVNTPSSDTTITLKNLRLNTLYSVNVRAIDFAGNVSEQSNTINTDTYVNGLYYEHSTGAWNSLSAIDWSKPEFTGTVNNFTLSPKTQDDFYNIHFDGYLNVSARGVYQFRTSSDDGSRLSINDSLLVDNDGVHNFAAITSPIHLLEAGPQRIQVEFFDYYKSDSLLVEYKGPDTNNEWTAIPDEVLKSTIVTALENPTAMLELNVFPNPTTRSNINLQLNNRNSNPLTVIITDAMGKKYYEQNFTSNETLVRISIQQPMAQGFYTVHIRQGENSVTRKLVISY